MKRFLDARPPSQLVTKVRDKFFPRFRLSVATSYGILPYDKNDIVATHVARGTFELGEARAFLRMMPTVKGLIDVGANLGFYTLLGSRCMAPLGRVISFEASNVELDKLQWTVAKNGLSNVTVVHAAVSDANGSTSVYESLSGMGALNRLDRAAKPSGTWRESTVPMTSLDAWDQLNGPIHVDLVKIDVEGHELPVLLGANLLMKRELPAVMIEMNPGRSSQRSAPQMIWDLVSSWGYKWYGLKGEIGDVVPCETFGEAINMFAIHPASPNPELLKAILSTAP